MMTRFPTAKFLTSAAQLKQFVADHGKEVAFAGRSNAGKSSALNAITGRTGLARVSRTPGRTQLINFFEVGEDRRLVDLPGYGFAKVPESVKRQWLALMEQYFNERKSLAGLVLIVDSRRGLREEDAHMLEWLLGRGLPAQVILSKADKLSRREATDVLRQTQEACAEAGIGVQLFSAHAKVGLRELDAVILGWLNS
jgi:GTP-binding protein